MKKIIALIGIFILTSCTLSTNESPPLQIRESFQQGGEDMGAWEIQERENLLETEALLGVLKDEVGKEQWEELYQLVQEKNAQRRIREDKKSMDVSKKEDKTTRKIHELLNQWTDDILGTLPPQSFINHFETGRQEVLNRVKENISQQDGKKLDKFFDALKKMRQQEEYDFLREDEIMDEFVKILSSYPELDGEQILYSIWGNEETLAVFDVKNGQLEKVEGKRVGLASVNEQKQQEAKKYWESVKQILPESAWQRFERFVVMSDGLYGTFAYVDTMDKKGVHWKLALDGKDLKDETESIYTLIHEFAHVFSLDSTQVEYDWEGFAPRSIFWDDEVKAKQDSYLNAFYKAFWERIVEDNFYDDEHLRFYLRHHNEFVTAYAATDPAEDFAESFAFYVLSGESSESMIQKKMDFFKAYPELERLKEEILKTLEKNYFVVEHRDSEFIYWESLLSKKQIQNQKAQGAPEPVRFVLTSSGRHLEFFYWKKLSNTFSIDKKSSPCINSLQECIASIGAPTSTLGIIR